LLCEDADSVKNMASNFKRLYESIEELEISKSQIKEYFSPKNEFFVGPFFGPSDT